LRPNEIVKQFEFGSVVALEQLRHQISQRVLTRQNPPCLSFSILMNTRLAYLMRSCSSATTRSKFELFAISFGRKDDSPMYRRLTSAFDRFVDVSGLSDHAAAN